MAMKPDALTIAQCGLKVAAQFSDILHQLEARGIELSPLEDRAWAKATADHEALRAELAACLTACGYSVSVIAEKEQKP